MRLDNTDWGRLVGFFQINFLLGGYIFSFGVFGLACFVCGTPSVFLGFELGLVGFKEGFDGIFTHYTF
jgi:hypothetical protein